MRDVYSNISDDLNFFGFNPEYIPFPAIEPQDNNAFAKADRIAKERLAVAATKEATALASNRSYDTDAAAFQSELARIRNNYENELAQLCGTFQAEDGNIYPAIRKYAHLNETTSLLGDPCGLVGNGAIHDAMAQMEIAGLDFQSVVLGHDNVISQIEIEKERVNAQCDLTLEIADYKFHIAGREENLKNYIHNSELVIRNAERVYDIGKEIAENTKCSLIVGVSAGGDCVTAVIAAAGLASAYGIFGAISEVNEEIIFKKEQDLAELNREATHWVSEQECTAAQINSDATVKGYLLELNRFELDALKAQYQTRLALSNIEKLRHQAKRLTTEQEESEDLAINSQAAQNNPNVRIYKNDAIITADRTFQAALKEAYKATRVFEY